MCWKILSTILFVSVLDGFSLSGQLVQWVAPMSFQCMYLLNFKVVLGLRNFGLLQVLILSILHFIWTCLFVNFGVTVTVVPATRNNNHKENLLQPAGPGQNQSVQEAVSKNKIPCCSKTLLSFYGRLFFFLSCSWAKLDEFFHWGNKSYPSPCCPTSVSLLENLELQVFLGQL